MLPQLLYKSSVFADNQTAVNSTDGQFLLSEPTSPSIFKRPDGKDGYSLITEDSEEDEEDHSDPAFEWTDVMTGSVSTEEALDPPHGKNNNGLVHCLIKGYLDTTELYYGAYVNHTISVVSGYFYNLPLANLLATVVHLIVCLCLLARW